MFFCCLGNKLLLQVYWCTYREAANSAVKKTSIFSITTVFVYFVAANFTSLVNSPIRLVNSK